MLYSCLESMTKKSLLISGLVVATIVVVTARVIFLPRHHAKMRFANVSLGHPAYEAVIGRGLSWLQQPSADVKPFQWLLINYLQRKFALDPALSASRELPPQTEGEAARYQVYHRIIAPNDLPSSLPLADEAPVDQMVMMAMHCDHIALPAHFDQLVSRSIAAGGYSLTHAALSLQRLRENGCSLPGDQINKLRQRATTSIAATVGDKGPQSDWGYEAVALLFDSGRRDLVRPSWIAQIAQQQQADGHWGGSVGTNGNDHTTVLALWAVLAFTHPNAPNEPMLRPPVALTP